MITIRLLDAQDAQRFTQLRLQAIETSPTAIWPTWQEEQSRSTEQTVARIQSTPTQAVFGAFLGDLLVGLTGVRREPLSQVAHKATIWGVFVDPAQRGKGVAQALLAAATEHASREWGVIQLLLCVNAQNNAAKKLYSAAGFIRFGIEPRAMSVEGHFYDEEHLFKRLDDLACVSDHTPLRE